MTQGTERQDQCHFCDAPATSRCRRCHKLYCDAHGDNLCDECADPASAIPSPTVFRGSLLALAFGTIIAIWLLVSPPQIEGGNDRTSAPAPTETPAGTPTPAPSPTPEPTQAPPTPTPAPEPQVHVVVDGDTLSGIAQRYGVTVEELKAYNGLESNTLQTGDQILIPPKPQ